MAGPPGYDGDTLRPTLKVARAQGMVSVQAECAMAEALGMMKERAIVSGLTLDEIAEAVIAREIGFGQ